MTQPGLSDSTGSTDTCAAPGTAIGSPPAADDERAGTVCSDLAKGLTKRVAAGDFLFECNSRESDCQPSRGHGACIIAQHNAPFMRKLATHTFRVADFTTCESAVGLSSVVARICVRSSLLSFLCVGVMCGGSGDGLWLCTQRECRGASELFLKYEKSGFVVLCRSCWDCKVKTHHARHKSYMVSATAMSLNVSALAIRANPFPQYPFSVLCAHTFFTFSLIPHRS